MPQLVIETTCKCFNFIMIITDLATATVSTETKPLVKAPSPASPPAFPRIDLKSIARAISMYRQAALQMMGESAPKTSSNVEEKKSNIPQPKAVPQLQEYIKKVQLEDSIPAPPPAPAVPGRVCIWYFLSLNMLSLMTLTCSYVW